MKIINFLLKSIFYCAIIILMCNVWVVFSTKKEIYFSSKDLPSNDYGLVLGTSKKTGKNKENLYYKYRIDAAAKLYFEGKVKRLILSGNNDSPYYNEPRDMKASLQAKGIPAEAMILDYNGFRTYDSIVRAKKVFDQKNVTIISQPFHNHRALYICLHSDIHAVSFAAQDVPKMYSVKTILREYFARPLTLVDVHLLNPIISLTNIPIENKPKN
jgi:SanA protein